MSNTLQGAFPDLSNEEHHGHPAIGSSGLKLLGQSPLHYWAAYLDPDRVRREPTPAMRLGTATHMAVLEPGRFDTAYMVMPEGLDRRTKEGKQLWADIVASGKECLTSVDMDRIRSMATAARNHPVSRVLFDQLKAKTEVSLFWVDPITGVNCKIRPDIMVEPCGMFPNGLIADLKTTDDASPGPDGFARSIWNWEMHLQAYLYPVGFMNVYGTTAPPEFLWLAQEKEAPFANKYYPCSQSLSDYGGHQVRRLLRIYADCLATGKWPGYSTEVEPLQMPGWASKVIDETIFQQQ